MGHRPFVMYGFGWQSPDKYAINDLSGRIITSRLLKVSSH